MKKKVIVGMSGGVDSSVSALLLKKQGFEVKGIFMQNWDNVLNGDFNGNPEINDNKCNSAKDYEDVISVCKELNIECERINFIKEYWNEVFLDFIEELKKYRTPNPDVLCNKYIKFEYFRKYAIKLGADYIATGHYAKIDNINDVILLKKPLDINKDQTYFLSQLKSYQLKNVIFPLQDLIKKEVRKIAENNNLITAMKKDSTGICFIGKRNFSEFISNYIDINPGDIVNNNNIKIGRHNGLHLYTIGQRKGLNIQYGRGPWFVYGKNTKKNQLLVTDNNNKHLLESNSCIVKKYSFINKLELKEIHCKVKVRYSQKEFSAILYIKKDYIKVIFKENIMCVTPGQAIAFYENDICIGGGIIDDVFLNDKLRVYY